MLTEEQKTKRRAYYLKNREIRLAYRKSRMTLPEVKIARKEYLALPEVKAAQKAHRALPEVKESQKARNALPETKIKQQKLYIERMKDPLLKEKERARLRAYYKSPEGREIMRKHRIKRRKNLDFNPMNKWFPNSHAHHINTEQVIYIPKEIHLEHAGHNHKKPETMIVINKAAFQYLTDTIKQL